jgi:hypothetical protein
MLLGDLTISASSAQKAVATPPPRFAMNRHADSHRHPTVDADHTELEERYLL